MEKFAIGFVMGGLVGALVVANNHKMRALVKKAQEEAQTKLDAIMDEKICVMEQGMQKAAEKAEALAEEVEEKWKNKKKK